MPRAPLSARSLTYPEVGATAGPLPAGYAHVRTTRTIGRGEPVFRSASDRLLRWEMHRAAGMSVRGSERAELGSRVLLRWGGRVFGVSAPCQVVDVDVEPRHRGFAYGTLEGHPERGEERFSVEWRENDEVTLTITAFSRPGTWWSRAASPISRHIQNRIIAKYLRAL